MNKSLVTKSFLVLCITSVAMQAFSMDLGRSKLKQLAKDHPIVKGILVSTAALIPAMVIPALLTRHQEGPYLEECRIANGTPYSPNYYDYVTPGSNGVLGVLAGLTAGALAERYTDKAIDALYLGVGVTAVVTTAGLAYLGGLFAKEILTTH